MSAMSRNTHHKGLRGLRRNDEKKFIEYDVSDPDIYGSGKVAKNIDRLSKRKMRFFMGKEINVCIICAESAPGKLDPGFPHLCKKHKKQIDNES